MNEYQAAKLDPFAPRQCFHWNSDGIRCRAFACHNEYTCFHHRCPDEPSIPIIANDPFTLPPLRTRHAIQDALDVIATLLAGKRIDDRRAKLLLYTIQLASNQLPRPTAATRPEAAANAESAPIHNQAPTTDTAPLSVCHSDPEHREGEGEESPHFVEPPQNCHPERSPLSEPQASRMGAQSKDPDILHTATADSVIPIEAAPTAASRYPEDSSSGLSSPAEEGVSTPGLQTAPTNHVQRTTYNVQRTTSELSS